MPSYIFSCPISEVISQPVEQGDKIEIKLFGTNLYGETHVIVFGEFLSRHCCCLFHSLVLLFCLDFFTSHSLMIYILANLF